MTGDWHKTERALLGVSVGMAILVVVFLIFGLTSLSESLVHAFSAGGQNETVTQFDFQGYEVLMLQ